jgi:ribosomal protein L11 methyltransferase
VPAERAEEARAAMLALFPEGFEEREGPGRIELAAYTDAAGEERARSAFGSVTATDVDDGWAHRWREFHHAMRVGPLWVGPPWEAPAEGALAVVVDPGRAFGTGAHPTTRLCLELLAGLEPAGLLDVGCGSGVLAIAGARLGFAPVVAVDVEPDAVEATRRNAAANGVDVDARRADALADLLPAAETVTANVDLAVVEALAPRLACRHLVASGYLVADEPTLPGFERIERREADGWAADLAVRSPGARQ